MCGLIVNAFLSSNFLGGMWCFYSDAVCTACWFGSGDLLSSCFALGQF